MAFVDIEKKKKARVAAETQSKYNDMKQHADKLIQGFSRLNESHAKRAIWELFQNAVDLSDHAEIVVFHRPGSLVFKHNGTPFDDNTLNCLIKQVSSKSADKKADEQIGQYGTGFITTHSFGRKILLSGSLRSGDSYIPLKDFSIDRTPRTAPELINNLIIQQDAVFELIENGEYLDACEPLTSFEYVTESDLQKKYAKQALESLPEILPYVMAINGKIKLVTVVDEATGVKDVYKKGNLAGTSAVKQIEIMVNDVPIVISYLEDTSHQMIVLLPVDQDNQAFRFPSVLPRLFLYYPLIGTEDFGINFIIHSRQFRPTEPRDGIYLQSTTEQVQEDEEANRLLIARASAMIFEWMGEHVTGIKDPICLAKIHFRVNSGDALLDEYFSKLQSDWVQNFKGLPLVETNGDNYAPDSASFLDMTLLADERAFDTLYDFSDRYYYGVPKRELARDWSLMMGQWGLPDMAYIVAANIVERIQADGNLSKFSGNEPLLAFYRFLIRTGQADFFSNFALLPNVKGEFRKFSALNVQVDLPGALLAIADAIHPETTKRHIHPDFTLDLPLAPFDRKNYTAELSSQITTVVKDNSRQKDVPPDFFAGFLDFCKVNTSTEANSVPVRIIRAACVYYGHDPSLIVIPPLKDAEWDIRTTQKKLVRLFLNDVSCQTVEWVRGNTKLLLEWIEVGSGYSDFQEFFQTLSLFPNQYDELSVQATLKIDDHIPEELKDLYDLVVRPNKDIRATLVDPAFAAYLKTKDRRTARSLTEAIESRFSSDGQYANINDHPFRTEILGIINRMTTDSEWGQYFPLLNGKKANVILDTFSNERIKADVFSIVTLAEDKIGKIGALVRNENFEQIIALGTQALEEVQKKKSDFQFKHQIGKRIETLIRERIEADTEAFAVKVEDVQNGQDIVVLRNEKPVYYVEVKSRWSTDSSIMMSKNQFTNAAGNMDRYSLCCVEMSDYKLGEPGRYEVPDTYSIIDRIKILNDIGGRIAPLLGGILSATDVANDITLTGDYKITIPQRLVREGMDIEGFVAYLVGVISGRVTEVE